MESIGVERALNVYGHSKGWRRQELRTANGFNVSGIGLDVAVRGVKLDQYRPDLIILDDVDSQEDSADTVTKKINAITTAILPSGSADCAVLFVQNKISSTGVMARLCDNTADYLHNREPAFVEPAVIGLQTTTVDRGDGLKEFRITGGSATWEGQSLAVCEQQLNEWGETAFLREAQHEVEVGEGYVFNVSAINYIDTQDVPEGLKECLAWDEAATEGAGDYTVGLHTGVDAIGRFYILDMVRGQWDTDKVQQKIELFAERVGCPSRCILHLPQDPAQAGKYQRSQQTKAFERFKPRFHRPTGSKVTRAYGFSQAMNAGNVYVVRAPWNVTFREECRLFREDEKHEHDDIVDAGADGYNELVTRGKAVIVQKGAKL